MPEIKPVTVVPSVEAVNKFVEGLFWGGLVSVLRGLKAKEDKKKVEKLND